MPRDTSLSMWHTIMPQYISPQSNIVEKIKQLSLTTTTTIIIMSHDTHKHKLITKKKKVTLFFKGTKRKINWFTNKRYLIGIIFMMLFGKI